MRNPIGSWTLLALVVSACGGGGGNGPQPATGSAPDRTVAAIAPSLIPLGDLAVLESEPIEVTFDSSGGSVTLADESTVTVPAGALGGETEFVIALVDIRLEDVLEDPPDESIYILSTTEPVDLELPVVLDVPIPSSEASVEALIDGDWMPVPIAHGETTKIEFDHFSEQIRAVIPSRAFSTFDTEYEQTRERERERARRGAAYEPAYRLCVQVAAKLIPKASASGFAADLFMGKCMAAVADVYGPDEVRTEPDTECLTRSGDAVMALLEMLDRCVPDLGDQSDTERDAAAPPEDVSSTGGAQGPLEFSGAATITLVYNEPDNECSADASVQVDMVLNPDGTATLGLSDWPVQGVSDDDPMLVVCTHMVGRPRTYGGFWFDRRAEAEAGLQPAPGEEDALPIEAGFDVPNTDGTQTGYSIVVHATDECAYSSSNFADTAFPRRFIVNFAIPDDSCS